uniref:Conotoxin superfamily I2 n=1 Tax=Conus ermineus TaxID=55423 RepID=A0A346CIR6_CONER|nr:conotoxin precursor superfamily I2 [Conus ermineus]
MMFRVTSVGCFLLVIIFLNLVVLTNACKLDEMSCRRHSQCCGAVCCSGTCAKPCRIVGKRAKLQEFFRQR